MLMFIESVQAMLNLTMRNVSFKLPKTFQTFAPGLLP